MRKVAAFVPDLMDRSRISAAAPATRFASMPSDLVALDTEVDIIIVDLSRQGVMEALEELTARTIGFAPHVDRETFDLARAAGCEEVMPRSEFFRRIAKLLE